MPWATARQTEVWGICGGLLGNKICLALKVLKPQGITSHENPNEGGLQSKYVEYMRIAFKRNPAAL